MSTLEELIAFSAPIEKVYKMLIILSHSEGSLKVAYFEQIVKDILLTYGFEEIKRIENMIRENVIQVSGGVFSGMNKSKFILLAEVSD